MVQLQEISDEVAARLKLSDEEYDAVSAPTPATAGPEISPGRAMESGKTVDEVVADLKKSPFFMTELEENDDTEALKALAYEGTPLENAANFKDQGNESFKARRWADAKEFYTKGVLLLAAEERRRARGEAPPPERQAEEEGDPDAPETVQEQRTMLEALYVNRAACHLELRNYRSCFLDGSAALRLNPKNIKAYYRSARAFLAVGRIAEADEACAAGLELDPENKALRATADDIIKKNEETIKKQRKEAERLAREKRRETLIKAAITARGIRTRATEKPPEMEDAGLRLEPDPDDPRSELVFPAVLLYPADLESDFIKGFGETSCLGDHLGYVFPLPWDKKGEYTADGVECYMETVPAAKGQAGGLIKVGKKVPLLKMLASGKVEVVDEVVRFYVLPKAKAEGWVKEFKAQKAVEAAARG